MSNILNTLAHRVHGKDYVLQGSGWVRALAAGASQRGLPRALGLVLFLPPGAYS